MKSTNIVFFSVGDSFFGVVVCVNWLTWRIFSFSHSRRQALSDEVEDEIVRFYQSPRDVKRKKEPVIVGMWIMSFHIFQKKKKKLFAFMNPQRASERASLFVNRPCLRRRNNFHYVTTDCDLQCWTIPLRLFTLKFFFSRSAHSIRRWIVKMRNLRGWWIKSSLSSRPSPQRD